MLRSSEDGEEATRVMPKVGMMEPGCKDACRGVELPACAGSKTGTELSDFEELRKSVAEPEEKKSSTADGTSM